MSKERTVAGKYSSVPKDNYTMDPRVDNTGTAKGNSDYWGEYSDADYENLHTDIGSAALPVVRRKR